MLGHTCGRLTASALSARYPRAAPRPGTLKILDRLQPVVPINWPPRSTRIGRLRERSSDAAVPVLELSRLAGRRQTATRVGSVMAHSWTAAAVTADTALQDVRTRTPAAFRRWFIACTASA